MDTECSHIISFNGGRKDTFLVTKPSIKIPICCESTCLIKMKISREGGRMFVMRVGEDQYCCIRHGWLP